MSKKALLLNIITLIFVFSSYAETHTDTKKSEPDADRQYDCWRLTFYECLKSGPHCFWASGQCRRKVGLED